MSTDIVPIAEGTLPALVRPVASPAELISYHKEVTKLITESLQEGIDFGKVPGTDKPTLLKPGAERLCLAFGAHPEFTLVTSEVDHDRQVFFTKRKKVWGQRRGDFRWEETAGESQGLYRYVYECKIVRADGRVLGTGQGVCSTMESKYVDRPRDCENTALKMAQKRALVAAVLIAFGLSNRFTQDVEDMDHLDAPSAAPPPEPERPAPRQAPASAHPPANEKPKEASIYTGTSEQAQQIEKILEKRKVPKALWPEIDEQLRGKPSTALWDIIPAVQQRAAEVRALS